MMRQIILYTVLGAATLVQQSFAQTTSSSLDPQLVGTWSSKSKTVMTGPDFYDPVKEELKEPKLPGISFSFTDDGKFEEAQYVVIPNPTKPECPSAMLFWQHGDYTIHPNGSLTLSPIEVDSRQLVSDPCESDESTYARVSHWELYDRYEVLIDPYHKKRRLNLFKHDGAPMNPMYIAYEPPQMLPTETLNPTATKEEGAKETGKAKKVKRDITGRTVENSATDPDKFFWLGLGMIGLGLVGFWGV